MKLKYLALAAAAIPAAPALAQDADSDTAPVIVVTGHGLPETPATPAYDTIELERDQIVSTASGRLEDVLSSVAGFQTFRRSDSRSSNPTSQGVTLRALGGNATSRALVLLDGVPLADPFFGYIPLTAVAPARLESIRVTRGGGSGPFGAGALAGTIELESADAATLGVLSGEALIDDRGETELSGTLAPRVGEGFAVVSGRWDRGKGFYTTPRDQRVPATARAAFDTWSASARLVEPLGDDVEVQLRGLAYKDTGTLRFKGADFSSTGQDVSARLVSHGPWQIDALAYGQWRNYTNIIVSSNTYKPVVDQHDTPSTGFGGKLEVRPPVGADHVFRIGADYRRAEGDLVEINAFSGPRYAGGVNSDFGLFVEDDWILGDLILTGGLRGDRTTIRDGYFETVADGRTEYPNRADWTLSYRAGAVFKASDAIRLRAAAYTGLRQPTLNELYRPYQIFPVEYLANAELKNERLQGFEAGIDFRPAPGLSFALTAFDNKLENAIANVTIGPNLSQRRNLNAVEAQGLEFAAAFELGQVSFDGTLAYTDSTVRGRGSAAVLDGNRPPQTPQWAASGTVSWRPAEHMLFAATLRHVGGQFEDDLETNLLPAATTVDLFAQVPIVGALSFVARAENLFDEKVVTRNDGPDSIDLGTPRTLWAGLRYGF
jgi:outer membrane receptor protein involved in Fe transport